MKRNGDVYFPMLEAEIARRGIKKKDIAARAGIEISTFYYKLNGKRPFTLDQALNIWKMWFVDIPIEKLFQKKRGE